MDLSMLWYLVPSVIMFAAGVYRYLFPDMMEGMVFTLFAIAIAAAETAVAIAIIVNIYRAVGNTDINSVKKMKY